MMDNKYLDQGAGAGSDAPKEVLERIKKAQEEAEAIKAKYAKQEES